MKRHSYQNYTRRGATGTRESHSKLVNVRRTFYWFGHSCGNPSRRLLDAIMDMKTYGCSDPYLIGVNTEKKGTSTRSTEGTNTG